MDWHHFFTFMHDHGFAAIKPGPHQAGLAHKSINLPECRDPVSLPAIR
jgi:hypothetical protein